MKKPTLFDYIWCLFSAAVLGFVFLAMFEVIPV